MAKDKRFCRHDIAKEESFVERVGESITYECDAEKKTEKWF